MNRSRPGPADAGNGGRASVYCKARLSHPATAKPGLELLQDRYFLFFKSFQFVAQLCSLFELHILRCLVFFCFYLLNQFMNLRKRSYIRKFRIILNWNRIIISFLNIG